MYIAPKKLIQEKSKCANAESFSITGIMEFYSPLCCTFPVFGGKKRKKNMTQREKEVKMTQK